MGAPGWIGNGKFYSQDNADFIVAFIKGAKQYHDLDISYCGCWNEKPYDTEWLKLLRKTLDRNGLKQVKIVAADEVINWNIADKMAKDAVLARRDPGHRHALPEVQVHGDCAEFRQAAVVQRRRPVVREMGRP